MVFNPFAVESRKIDRQKLLFKLTVKPDYRSVVKTYQRPAHAEIPGFFYLFVDTFIVADILLGPYKLIESLAVVLLKFGFHELVSVSVVKISRLAFCRHHFGKIVDIGVIDCPAVKFERQNSPDVGLPVAHRLVQLVYLIPVFGPAFHFQEPDTLIILIVQYLVRPVKNGNLL